MLYLLYSLRKLSTGRFMTKPKVSVIMPVFNTEQYVYEALMSIVNQTLKDIEIIVINDGSTDNSLQVVTEIAEKDPRLQVYCQENQGQSVARNFGISKAKGDYIYFMDSDDLLDMEALERCYEKCVAEDLDFVFFDAEILCENKELSLAFDYHRPEIEEKVYNGIELLNELIDRNLYRVSPCLMIIKRDFIHNTNISFYPCIIHEDELFSTILHIEAHKVGRIGKSFFKRRIRGNSTMTRHFSRKNIEGYFTVFHQLHIWGAKKDSDIKVIIQKTICYIINPMFYNARVLPLKEKVGILTSCIIHNYIKHVKVKNIIVFFFPSSITIKSLFKTKPH